MKKEGRKKPAEGSAKELALLYDSCSYGFGQKPAYKHKSCCYATVAATFVPLGNARNLEPATVNTGVGPSLSSAGPHQLCEMGRPNNDPNPQ